ncbi:MAG: hypothetical protein LBS91_00030 [Clostridiales Family XIII bacterium]|jgi:hypothetical protein|nr:hypothetical protein [Clostridiales Family XIII bacterium]
MQPASVAGKTERDGAMLIAISIIAIVASAAACAGIACSAWRRAKVAEKNFDVALAACETYRKLADHYYSKCLRGASAGRAPIPAGAVYVGGCPDDSPMPETTASAEGTSCAGCCYDGGRFCRTSLKCVGYELWTRDGIATLDEERRGDGEPAPEAGRVGDETIERILSKKPAAVKRDDWLMMVRELSDRRNAERCE